MALGHLSADRQAKSWTYTAWPNVAIPSKKNPQTMESIPISIPIPISISIAIKTYPNQTLHSTRTSRVSELDGINGRSLSAFHFVQAIIHEPNCLG